MYRSNCFIDIKCAAKCINLEFNMKFKFKVRVFDSINNIFFQTIFQSQSIHKLDKIRLHNVYAYISLKKAVKFKVKNIITK